ncbi:MAG TPA: hypothetical protein VGF67_26795 [Ktedonobacteraceae bacterium]|jgi:hypothetical protein
MRQLRELSHTLRQGGVLSAYATFHLSWWHTPLFGYLMSFLLVAIAIALVRFLFLREVHFIWIPFCLLFVLVGFVWGTSPALLATLLGFLAFTFFVIPQDAILSPNIWNDIRLPGPLYSPRAPSPCLQRSTWRNIGMYKAPGEIQAYAQRLAIANRELE